MSKTDLNRHMDDLSKYLDKQLMFNMSREHDPGLRENFRQIVRALKEERIYNKNKSKREVE